MYCTIVETVCTRADSVFWIRIRTDPGYKKAEIKLEPVVSWKGKSKD